MVAQIQCTSVRCATRSAAVQPGQFSTAVSRWSPAALAKPSLRAAMVSMKSNPGWSMAL
jgi:hypothetical protein